MNVALNFSCTFSKGKLDFIFNFFDISIVFRDSSGGFIDSDKGDIHLFEMHCATAGAKKKNRHALGWSRNYHSTLNLMKQMCNACNRGIVSYDG